MKRRAFLSSLGAMAAWPIAVQAQPGAKMWRVGMLDSVPAEANVKNINAFRTAMHQLGYVEGKNLVIDYRSPDGHSHRLPELAAELVQLKCDVIVTRGTPMTLAIKNATSAIPIVMTAVAEPVQTGLVHSLPRPGGNVTGMSAFNTELSQKRIELLKELVPRISRVGFMANMSNASVPAQWNETRLAAQTLGVEALIFDVRKPEDIAPSFEAAVAMRVDAFTVLNDTVLVAARQQIIALAAEHRLPIVYASLEYVGMGGLLSYGANYPDLYRRAATYVDKIFKGAKPSELPVEQPTKLEIGINLKTAKVLGLTVPTMLLGRADEVIE
jgi:putative tryptophan/tyrosine transport system substrate-binding protein